MTNDIYSLYNIDKSKLKRDYLENPISKSVIGVSGKKIWERIPYDDLKYLYIDLNLEQLVIANFFNISQTKLTRDLHFYRLIKLNLHEKEKLDDTFYEKHKIDKTKLTRDYIKYPLKIIHLKGGGLEIPDKNDLKYFMFDLRLSGEVAGKYFGVTSGKYFEWCKIFNFKSPLKEIEFDNEKYEKAKEIAEQYSIDPSKMTRDYIKYPLKVTPHKCAIGYKIEVPKRDDFKYLFIDLNMIRREVATYFMVSDAQIKIWNRKFKCIKSKDKIYENCFKNWQDTPEIWTSEPEDRIHKELIKKFTVIRQYKSKEYPFNCDFYIPELDLYIEYNGHWTHGPIITISGIKYNCHEPYDESNMIHKKIVEYWGEKNSKQYDKAIKTWTISDVLKRETAMENNLNWVEFFSFDECIKWIEEQ